MDNLNENNNRKFEIPYNFDSKLLVGLNLLKINHKNISSIYLPPYEFDYPSVRRNDIMPNEKDHLDEIEGIQEQFPGKVRLLLQQPNDNYLMKGELLNKYLKLGINKFCVGSLNQAKEIKNVLPEAEIIGSIRMNINKEKIENNKDEYLKYFNSFVLNYTYNKNLDKIKNLPDYYKYILIVNSICDTRCEGKEECFDNNYNNFKCPFIHNERTENEISKLSFSEISFYDNFMYSYKIVERGSPTHLILKALINYM